MKFGQNVPPFLNAFLKVIGLPFLKENDDYPNFLYSQRHIKCKIFKMLSSGKLDYIRISVKLCDL